MGSTGKGYRAVCADIQSVAGSASDNIVYGGEYERRDTLCNSAELEFPISELFHDEFKFATGKY